jgi:RNA polymerase sigma-54 factor
MKQSLQLKLGQSLAMTPQLQQAIRLLQLSTMELQMEVQQVLDSNMMLETEEDDLADTGTEGTEDVEPLDIPGELELDTDWDAIYDQPSGVAPSSGDGGGEFEAIRASEESLTENLLWQLEMGHLSDRDKVVGAAVVDAVEDDGYLRTTAEELCESLANELEELEEDEVEAVIRHIQNFEPPGVCARNLGECLHIQLRQLDEDVPYRTEAMALVTTGFDALASRDFNLLIRMLRVTRETLQDVLALVHSLNPRPGASSHPKPSEYVTPDVVVTKRKGQWHVALNQEAMPRIRVNSEYASLVRRADNSPDNTSMRSHLQEARWFIKSLQSRSDTLLRVATCIVDRQRDFLEHGDEAMKPMVLHDVAEVVEMHESTISRVTTQKFMLTPRGVYELKYFFSSHVSTDTGGEASSTAIRALLKKLIAAENPGKPLSDSKLAKILGEQGINVARRTVAKYRESLAIPSSTERKQLV